MITDIKTVSLFVSTSKMGYIFNMQLPAGDSVERIASKDGYRKKVPFLTNGYNEEKEIMQAEFTLYDNGKFFCEFSVPAKQKGQELIIRVEAVNKKEHTESDEISVKITDIGPEILIFNPQPGEKAYFGPKTVTITPPPTPPPTPTTPPTPPSSVQVNSEKVCPAVKHSITGNVVNSETPIEKNIVVTKSGGAQRGLKIKAFVGKTDSETPVTKVIFRLKDRYNSGFIHKIIHEEEKNNTKPDLTGIIETEVDIRCITKKYSGVALIAPRIFQDDPVTFEVIAEDKDGNRSKEEFTIEPDKNPPVRMGEPKYTLKDNTFDVEFTIVDHESKIAPDTITVSGTPKYPAG